MAMMRAIDFETTGLSEGASVIELGWTDIETDGASVGASGSSLFGADAIEPGARAAHGIRLEDIKGLPGWQAGEFVDACAREGVSGFAAHNADFERRFLYPDEGGTHLPLICTYRAALRTWPDAPGHGCAELAFWLEDRGEIVLDPALSWPAHRAMPDSYLCAHLLAALIRKGASGRDLALWTREPKLFPRCGLGEHFGKPWAEVPDGFLRWMSGKEGLDPDARWCADREIDRRAGR